MDWLSDIGFSMLQKGITGVLTGGVIGLVAFLIWKIGNKYANRYRVGDDLSQKKMACNTCHSSLSGKFRYCKKCGRTYCVDCGIQICKCGGEVADAPEEV